MQKVIKDRKCIYEYVFQSRELLERKIYDISFTEEDIEEIFGILNENAAAEPDT